ncbi:MAG: HEAT repeat domain-containing protein [Planctomycetaceae bacterium]
MHQIRDDRVVSCLDKLRPLIVEPKFASGDAPLNSGDVITEFTILLRKCKMKASPIVARWLSEPEPVPGFHISLLVNFSSPGFLGSYLELDGQLIDGITRHFDSAKPAKRDAAIAALSTLLRGDDIVDISASSEHFTHALRTKDQSLLVSALNSLKLLSVKNPELLESQLRELVRSTELDVRAAAAAVFASLYPKMQKEVLPIAEEAIDTDLPEAVPLIQALGEDGVPLLPAIMQAIKRGHPNRDDWIMAEQSWANAFSEMRESDAVGPLLEGLQDKDPDVRWACASALRHFVNNQNVIDALAARVDDTAGGKFPVSRRAMESLMLADRPRDQLVPRLISVLNGISPQEQSATHRAAVRLLARIGPPAEKAFPPLAKYGYVQRVRYGVEGCSHVSIQSYETAVAARAVTPTSRIGLAGFREIIKSVASGRTWLPLSQHVETDTLDNTRNSGFAMTIDYIVEHEVKELADTLEQSSKPPLLHPDYRADLLFALAAVDPQGGWQIKLEALASSGSSRAKYRLGSDPDDVPF